MTGTDNFFEPRHHGKNCTDIFHTSGQGFLLFGALHQITHPQNSVLQPHRIVAVGISGMMQRQACRQNRHNKQNMDGFPECLHDLDPRYYAAEKLAALLTEI